MNKKIILSCLVVLAIQGNANYDASELPSINSEIESEVTPTAATDVVTIPDPALEAAVRDELSKPTGDITEADMATITELDATGTGITDLSGLNYATNLITLTLDDNEITDVSPLATLTNIDALSIKYNNISDISSLNTLVNMKVLKVTGNNISDISVVTNMPNITTLSIEGNDISDISAISSLTSLVNLYSASNNISDVSPLSGITTLEVLSIANNEITDISPLSGLTSLTTLALYGQTINLADIDVTTDGEIVFEVIDINGATQMVSLGTPIEGDNEMSGPFDFPTTIGSATTNFEGTVNQNVHYTMPSDLTGDVSASTAEETVLTAEELIALFNVENSEGFDINVDDSNVDYSTPGTYNVQFSDKSANVLDCELTITDVLPEITFGNDTVTVEVGSSLEDILNEINMEASEITNGDLNSVVSIDDSAVKYKKPGIYEIVFTVTDEEGNTVEQSIIVTIEEVIDNTGGDTDSTDKDTDSTDKDTDSTDKDTDSTDKDTDSTDASKDESEDDNTQMTLATTGATSTILLTVSFMVLGAAFKVKRVLSFK